MTRKSSKSKVKSPEITELSTKGAALVAKKVEIENTMKDLHEEYVAILEGSKEGALENPPLMNLNDLGDFERNRKVFFLQNLNKKSELKKKHEVHKKELQQTVNLIQSNKIELLLEKIKAVLA